jgi:hypothetical protein
LATLFRLPQHLQPGGAVLPSLLSRPRQRRRSPPQQGWSCPGFVEGCTGGRCQPWFRYHPGRWGHRQRSISFFSHPDPTDQPSACFSHLSTITSLRPRHSPLSLLDARLSRCSTLASLAARRSPLSLRDIPLSPRDACFFRWDDVFLVRRERLASKTVLVC